MHQRATGGGENNLLSRPEESPSPDPAGGQHYLITFDSRIVESWTKYEHHKGFVSIISTRGVGLSS